MVLVPALWHKVEEIVRPDKNVEPACIGGIGVEDVTVFVFVEDTQTRKFIHYELADLVIVIRSVFASPPL